MKRTICTILLVSVLFVIAGCNKSKTTTNSTCATDVNNKTTTGKNDTIVDNYTVIWKNYDGSILETDKNVMAGTAPCYDGETPTKENDGYVYTHNGWTSTIPDVDRIITYTATFDKISIADCYEREDDYIYFGMYPQTEVTDSELINLLNEQKGTLPTSLSNEDWTSYDYYIDNSNETNYMWYKDVEYKNETYRAVYFTSYRPYYASGNNESYQDESGYIVSKVYWFKFEPIKWRVLNEADGKAFILCDMIIDAQEFYPFYDNREVDDETIYANNWEYSTIRKWLNDSFYETAFTSIEKKLIIATELDNKIIANDSIANNQYAICQNNTTDNIFLLSRQDIQNDDYGFINDPKTEDTARIKKKTGYAKSQGAFSSMSYPSLGKWQLRSVGDDRLLLSCVDITGEGDYYNNVYESFMGIVPALNIRIS